MPRLTVKFGEYEVDTVRHELRRAGKPVRLQRQPCDLLLFLIENQGSVVTREQISERLWGRGVHKDAEHNINTAIRKIRYALRDNAGRQQHIKTVVGKGYTFVSETGSGPSVSLPAPQARDSALRKPAVVEVLAVQVLEGEDVDEKLSVPVKPSDAITLPPADTRNFVTRNPPRSGILLIGLAAALLGIAALAGTWAVRNAGKSPANYPAIRSLAILPFRNLTGDPEQDLQ